MRIRTVFDTNCLISSLLSPDSLVADSFRKALEIGIVFTSIACFGELSEVLQRPKFIKYFSEADLLYFREILAQELEFHPVKSKIITYRDPKDDKFLSLAKDAEADFLITGDKDLLDLREFEKTKIISPKSFLEQFT